MIWGVGGFGTVDKRIDWWFWGEGGKRKCGMKRCGAQGCEDSSAVSACRGIICWTRSVDGGMVLVDGRGVALMYIIRRVWRIPFVL